MKRTVFVSTIVLFISLIACAGVWAQATAQISGTARDQSGAVLPGVEVKVTQTETGIARTAVTNETGSYVLPNLAVGPYRMEAALPGFRTYVQSGIVLQVNASPVINIVLEVGQVAEDLDTPRARVEFGALPAGIGARFDLGRWTVVVDLGHRVDGDTPSDGQPWPVAELDRIEHRRPEVVLVERRVEELDAPPGVGAGALAGRVPSRHVGGDGGARRHHVRLGPVAARPGRPGPTPPPDPLGQGRDRRRVPARRVDPLHLGPTRP